jgi:hypothetical protein
MWSLPGKTTKYANFGTADAKSDRQFWKNLISFIYTYVTSIDTEFQDESIGVQCLCVLLRLFIIICKKDFGDGLGRF